MAFGVTENGFVLKRLADIRTDVQARLNTITDPISGETLDVDLQEDDPFVNVINAILDEIAVVHEVAQDAYNQFDPLRATGDALRSLVQLNGLIAQAATASRVGITVTGTANVLIPKGSRISNSAGTQVYETTDDIVIPGAGTTTGFATSTVTGPVSSAIGTLTSIVNPIAGWDTVTNPAAATPGTDAESDEALRNRRRQSTELPAASIVEAIRERLLAVEGVVAVRIFVNNQTTTVGSLGPKSITTVVLGGTDEDIARTLFLLTPATATWEGTSTFQITDALGTTHSVQFTRPTEVAIKLAVTVEVFPDFPSDGVDQIKNALVQYARFGARALGTTTGFELSPIEVGQTVYLTRFYTAVNSVPGHRITELLGAFAISPGDPNLTTIAIAFDQVATLDAADIEVTTF